MKRQLEPDMLKKTGIAANRSLSAWAQGVFKLERRS